MYSLAPDGSTVRSDNLFLTCFSLTVNNMSHQYSVVEKRRQPPGFQFEGRRRRRTYFAYHARAPPGRWGLSDESDDHHIGGCSSRAWAEEAHSSGDAFSVGKFPGVTSPDEAFSARRVASRVCSSVVRVRGFAHASLALLVRVSPRQARRVPKHRSSRARSTASAAGLAACENHSEEGGGVTRAAGASCVCLSRFAETFRSCGSAALAIAIFIGPMAACMHCLCLGSAPSVLSLHLISPSAQLSCPMPRTTRTEVQMQTSANLHLSMS